MDKPKLNAVVTLRNEVSPWLNILRIVPDGWDLPHFVPGQFISLGVPGSASRCALGGPEIPPVDPDKLIRRSYCIASSPLNREFMEFYVALVPGGEMTPRLFNLKIGDRIWLSEKASGAFTFEYVPPDANVVLMATGSALSPYMSMLSTHGEFVTQRRVGVIHGVRHSWELGYRSILMAMQHIRANFTYFPVISRPDKEPVPWTGAIGHVQDLWKGGAIEKAWGFRPGPKNTHVFLCGSPDMIEAMVAMLAQEGFEEEMKKGAGQIHVEGHWQHNWQETKKEFKR